MPASTIISGFAAARVQAWCAGILTRESLPSQAILPGVGPGTGVVATLASTLAPRAEEATSFANRVGLPVRAHYRAERIGRRLP